MKSDRTYSDEELTGFLDGELDLTMMEQIKTRLIDDRELGQRLADLHVDKDVLKAAFDKLDVMAPACPDFIFAENSNNSGTSWGSNFKNIAAAASLFIAVSIGAVGGYFAGLPKAEPMGWVHYVAAYQALYHKDTLEHVHFSDAELKTELERSAASIDIKIELAKLKSIDEMDYKRSQILWFKDKALVQLAFLNDANKAMALCIIKTTKANQTISYSVREGMQAAQWAKDGYDYFLIGGDRQELISKAAEAFYADL